MRLILLALLLATPASASICTEGNLGIGNGAVIRVESVQLSGKHVHIEYRVQGVMSGWPKFVYLRPIKTTVVNPPRRPLIDIAYAVGPWTRTTGHNNMRARLYRDTYSGWQLWDYLIIDWEGRKGRVILLDPRQPCVRPGYVPQYVPGLRSTAQLHMRITP